MLHENIKALRKAKGLSQEDLAVKLNVVRQTVSKWEKALSVPDAGMLMRIADALGTSVNVLLGEAVDEQDEDTTIHELASKLEQINEVLANQAEKRRKRWRICFIALGVIAACGIVRLLLDAYHVFCFNRELASSTAIGGVDAATGIYVSSINLHTFGMLMTLLAAVVAGIGIYRTRRK